MMENGLYDCHDFINGMENNKRDPTFIIGKKCIDAVLVSSRLIDVIDGCKLINFNKIIPTDY